MTFPSMSTVWCDEQMVVSIVEKLQKKYIRDFIISWIQEKFPCEFFIDSSTR